jgi:hypothetical protein
LALDKGEEDQTVETVKKVTAAQEMSVTTRVFGEENPTPCTLVIVPGSVAITYRTHYRIISFPYNENRVQNIIFTSETSRYSNLVQATWAKRQVEILRSGS